MAPSNWPSSNWRDSAEEQFDDFMRVVAFPNTFLQRWQNSPYLTVPSFSPSSSIVTPRTSASAYSAPMRCTVDVIERGNNTLQVNAELPGILKKDIVLDVEGNQLRIGAEKKSEHVEDNDRMHVAERYYGRVQRVVHLPYSVDRDSIKAEFSEGVLKMEMRKDASVEERKTILIQ